MPKLIRITTVPISIKLLLTGQMRFMKDNDYDVVMISSDGKERVEVIESEGCQHIIVPFTRQISLISDLLCLIRLIMLFIRLKPDIVHTHTPKAGLLGMIAAKLVGVPVRIHTIAGLPLMTATKLKRRILIATERITSWGAHRVLLNSHSILQYIKDRRLAPDSKLDIIGFGSTNGIDLERFARESLDELKVENYKSTYNPNGCFLILCVGRVVVDKGIIELVDAFVEFRSMNINCKLILLGPIETVRNEEVLPRRILDLIRNDDFIEHVDWSNEVEYFMAMSNLLIHASHREGFPNVLLQAGAIGLPILCSDIPGNIDVVRNNIDGWWFEKGSKADLIKKLNLIMVNLTSAKLMSYTLRKKIENNFDRRYIHQLLYEYYLEQLKA